MEEIAKVRPAGPRWFQLYLQPEWSASKRLVHRAERAGFSAIVLTADVPVLGVRDAQLSTGFAIDSTLPVGNGRDAQTPARGPELAGETYTFGRAAGESWEIVDQLRGATDLPIVVKGVMTGEDARKAIEHGAQAIVVSNHGGRQLDRSPSSLAALPEVVTAVGGKVEVYLDGGVRRGSDVLIALALGARAVGIGRPVLWALAAAGEAGVAQYLSLLAADLATSMGLVGCRSLSDIGPSIVKPYPS